MATTMTTVSALQVGDMILPPARELQLWMRRHVNEQGLSDNALRLTITDIREGHSDTRGRWLVIVTQQDPEWGTSRPFTFRARPDTAWPILTASQEGR